MVSTSAAQVFRSLCASSPHWEPGKQLFRSVTSLQHKLLRVQPCSLTACCAFTLALISFWVMVTLNHQMKTNEGESQKMSDDDDDDDEGEEFIAAEGASHHPGRAAEL